MAADQVRLPVPGIDELAAGIAVYAHAAHEERCLDPMLRQRGQYPFIHLTPPEMDSVPRNGIVEREGHCRARRSRQSARQRRQGSDTTRAAEKLPAVHGCQL